MKLYKVLEKGMISPFEGFQYQKNKWYNCDIEMDKHVDCATGFYATDVDGLPYSFDISKEVYRVEVKGKRVEIDQFKRRYESIKILEKIPHKEVKKLSKRWEKKVGYKLSEVLFPFNPFSKERKRVTKKDIKLLKKWVSVRDSARASVGASVGASVKASVGVSVGDSVGASVGASVGDSVWDSVWASVGASVWDSGWASVWDSVKDSVWDSGWDSIRDSGASVWDSIRASVGASVWDSGASVWDSIRASVGASVWDSGWASVWDSISSSVGASVWDSVGAYMGSLFPNIKKWKYVKHEKGKYPFQSVVDLWYRGLVPSYDGEKWRLYTGKDGKKLYEQEK